MNFLKHDPKKKTAHGATVQVGLHLVDCRGNYVGKVKEIKKSGFIADQSAYHLPDIFVPYDICAANGADQLKLCITRKELEEQAEQV